MKVNFVLLVKSHLQSYPCPLQINSFWILGFLLGITILLQIITNNCQHSSSTVDPLLKENSYFFVVICLYSEVYSFLITDLMFEFLLLLGNVNLRTSEIHLFYNLQLFFWHLLEILWLFIFLDYSHLQILLLDIFSFIIFSNFRILA
jgi:hypothetical protein